MIETNKVGVIISPPDLVKEFKLDDKNYVYLHFHRLDDGGYVYGYDVRIDNSWSCFTGPAVNKDRFQFDTLDAAVAYAIDMALCWISRSKHQKTVKLGEMIRFQDMQLELFKEVG